LAGLIATARTPQLVRSAGKPTAEPRVLLHLDSWQTVVFGAGDDVEEIRRRLLSLFQAQQRFVCEVERIWHWGLDGKTERDQVVIRHGRAIVFCHLYGYGSDLYVGWDAQMNLGSWTEKQIAAGVDRSSGRRIRLMSVERAVQQTSEYDLVDLNCLAEWTHAQMTQVLKHYMKEKQVDQEIDFTIIRGEREGITGEDKKEKIRGTKTDAGRFRFRRKS
jgi:hypothetical protein